MTANGPRSEPFCMAIAACRKVRVALFTSNRMAVWGGRAWSLSALAKARAMAASNYLWDGGYLLPMRRLIWRYVQILKRALKSNIVCRRYSVFLLSVAATRPLAALFQINEYLARLALGADAKLRGLKLDHFVLGLFGVVAERDHLGTDVLCLSDGARRLNVSTSLGTLGQDASLVAVTLKLLCADYVRLDSTSGRFSSHFGQVTSRVGAKIESGSSAIP